MAGETRMPGIRTKITALLATMVMSVAMTAALGSTQAAYADRCDLDVWCEDPTDPEDNRPPSWTPGGRITRVMSFGDSYASGEGAPDANMGKEWLDKPCHRSKLSGIAVALERLRTESPYRDEFTHYNYTCSGAAVVRSPGFDLDGDGDVEPGDIWAGEDFGGDGGILTPQQGPDKEAQIDQANAQVGDMVVDALTIGGGGNDVGFAPIVAACAYHLNCTSQMIANLWQQWHAGLPGRLNDLITAIQGDATGANRRLQAQVRDVYWTTYPDMTRPSSGTYCHNQGGFPLDWLSSTEVRWISQQVVAGLNQEIRAAVARANQVQGRPHPRWHVVEAEDWTGHSFCQVPSSKYLNNFDDSWNRQGDAWGIAHPNAAGYRSLANSYYRALSYLNKAWPSTERQFRLVAAHVNSSNAENAAGAVRQSSYVGWNTHMPPHQLWRAVRTPQRSGAGFVSSADGRCVTGTSVGANLTMEPCADDARQRWQFKPDRNGNWIIVTPGARNCLSVLNASRDWGTPYTVAPCTFESHQTFSLSEAYADLFRYNNTSGDHRTGIEPPQGYHKEGLLGRLSAGQLTGMTGLYSCLLGSDHFTSTDANCEGQRVLGRFGFLYVAAPPNTQTIPLHRCTVHGSGDHFDSTDPNCEGQRSEGRMGYLLA
ncbi:hypothetical protein Aph01nite_41590 [Acrocarpospora phusangensis]|uniref:Ricin B lectin domain-containing protein n=1 Tax=Acrocarpospora phusangensis TaxID=1070424 RepID=A0A919ULC5_9ACTN|nr:RICIN domain-containing protein [Acrocarpospora phusangensis]GIH25849.1 hypothetical protein Aph01nite_41590 [Acrocarpospora phusangensis]